MVMLNPGTLLQNRYVIERLVESGSDNFAYRAHDQRLAKPVTIKETLFRSPSFVHQFEFEAQLLANLRHPSLPIVIDYFLEPDGQYLVMEYVSGESLHTYLSRQPRCHLDEAAMVSIIRPLLDTLEYLHSYSPPIIHRDIQPRNVFLSANHSIYLLNFGIAKALVGNRPTTIGAASVTPSFSPIEQYGSGQTDARSDIYALGATIYTVLSGNKPRPAPKRVTLDTLKSRDTLQPLRNLNPSVSPNMESIVMRMLAVLPEHRYQDVASLRRDWPKT